jgi:hypothetical protein
MGARFELPQTVVDRIGEARRQGRDYKQIAAELNRDGVPTARGRRWDGSLVRYVVLSRGLPPVERGAPAHVAALIHQLHGTMSFPHVAAELNARGVRSPSGRPWSKFSARRVAAEGR